MTNPAFLVTGASDGIGAVYADRLARRGFDLVLVARRADRLAVNAARLEETHGVSVETIAADLAAPDDLAHVESRLREDGNIVGLVNNAGIAGEAGFAETDPAYLTGMIDLNVLAVTRLAAAVAPRFIARKGGTIINLSSVTALMPGAFAAVYPATKAFVLTFSEALDAELGRHGVRVQAVLPGITRTPIWTREQLSTLDPAMVMDAGTMVDAAMRGMELGETITIPALPETGDLDRFLSARDALAPNLSHSRAAARYRS